jgi:WD40 repeat protein
VKVWDFSTGKLLNTLLGHSDSVNTVIFSPDGKQLVTASDDKTVKVWDFSTGKLLNTLLGHSDSVNTVIFSPDGKQLVTASDDGTVKVWDFSTGKLLNTLPSPSRWVNTVIFSPDGKQLVTASSRSDTVRLWRLDLDFDDLVKEGCKFWGNYLRSNPNDEQAQEIERELCSKLSKR